MERLKWQVCRSKCSQDNPFSCSSLETEVRAAHPNDTSLGTPLQNCTLARHWCKLQVKPGKEIQFHILSSSKRLTTLLTALASRTIRYELIEKRQYR
jgi:hypothetical protein